MSAVIATKTLAKSFDVATIRQDFPILQQNIHGKPLVYLDNSATQQKPQAVIDAISHYYAHDNANVHRGVHTLSERASHAFDRVRELIKNFIHARHAHEIIFVRGATEAINLVAQSYGRSQLKAGDEIIITTLEHHSNIVPWQMLCEQIGTKLRVAPISDSGEIILSEFAKLLNPRTKMLALVHASNVLGTINPVQEMIAMAHAHQVPVLLDGAQAIAHLSVDVQKLDCDFYVFSGHKMCGPTGIGVLYGKTHLLEAMPPYQGGGAMINQVSFAKTTYAALPHKFEAGTPDIAGVIGLGAAIEYLMQIGIENIAVYEQQLLDYATQALQNISGLQIIGTAKHKAPVISFVMNDVHPHDIGTILDYEGVAIRAGHHCAMPLMERLGLAATARASFAFYNTQTEIDRLVDALKKVREIFK